MRGEHDHRRDALTRRADVSDRLGPKYTFITALLVQAAFGFGLAGGFPHLRNNLAGIIM